MHQGMFQSQEEPSPTRVAGVLSPVSITLPRELWGCSSSHPTHTGIRVGQGRTPAGHGAGMSPWSLPGRVGTVPGGCQGAQRAPCCLPVFLPPFSQHSVPSVNDKYISHGGRSSDKPCRRECSRALLPVCWPWHLSHSLCTKSQSSTQGLQVLRAAAIPMATAEQHVDNHHQVIKHCKETQSIPPSHSLS